MTIERKDKPFVKFEELPLGAVFEHEKEIYMKTDREKITAVELEFGILRDIEKDTLVRPLNARLTVTE